MNIIKIEATLLSMLVYNTAKGKVANLLVSDNDSTAKVVFKCALWGQDAEKAEKSLTKGDMVSLTGHITQIAKNNREGRIEIPNAQLVSARRVVGYQDLLECDNQEVNGYAE